MYHISRRSRFNLIKTTKAATATVTAKSLSSLSCASLSSQHLSLTRQFHGHSKRSAETTDASNPSSIPRESMSYDVVIVGAGPAGLSAAIQLKNLAKKKDQDISVCIVEKGVEVGAHILSGNVLNPVALNELIPDWKDKDSPIKTKVTRDKFYFLLNQKTAIPLPVPPPLHNDGNYVVSLGNVCRWLATQAEELGVEIYPGFSASEALFGDQGQVIGIATSDLGIGKDGQPKDSFARGMELMAKQVILAEGCRGSLSESIMTKFDLRQNSQPQQYGIGLKEIWQVDNSKFESGFVQHTAGWPVDMKTYAGSFLYHMDPNYVLIGYVVGLDYKNPYLSPYEEFQRMKTHPVIKKHLEGGTCVEYGSRALNEGGFQSIPKLTFPGGVLVGCAAGFLNVPKIKGTHYAMKSGMLAAESIYDSLSSSQAKESGEEITSYSDKINQSWIRDELYAVRNCQPSFHWGSYAGIAYNAFQAYIFRGYEPWTFSHKTKNCDETKPAKEYQPIDYPKPDNKLTFDLLTNLARSGTNHEEDQPSHLKIKPDKQHVPQLSFKEYAAPESRFCPAKVYEYVTDPQGEPKLVINAQNCLHCKTCSIKTPQEYILWTVPEGGGGPKYQNM